jgi:hypothetical protein
MLGPPEVWLPWLCVLLGVPALIRAAAFPVCRWRRGEELTAGDWARELVGSALLMFTLAFAAYFLCAGVVICQEGSPMYSPEDPAWPDKQRVYRAYFLAIYGALAVPGLFVRLNWPE